MESVPENAFVDGMGAGSKGRLDVLLVCLSLKSAHIPTDDQLFSQSFFSIQPVPCRRSLDRHQAQQWRCLGAGLVAYGRHRKAEAE